MKKLILVVVLVLAAIWAFGQRYTVKSARSTDGTYNVVIVNKSSGEVHRVMGK